MRRLHEAQLSAIERAGDDDRFAGERTLWRTFAFGSRHLEAGGAQLLDCALACFVVEKIVDAGGDDRADLLDGGEFFDARLQHGVDRTEVPGERRGAANADVANR